MLQGIKFALLIFLAGHWVNPHDPPLIVSPLIVIPLATTQ
jgi:hypothetical protein